jgi:hypothetical protein
LRLGDVYSASTAGLTRIRVYTLESEYLRLGNIFEKEKRKKNSMLVLASVPSKLDVSFYMQKSIELNLLIRLN